MAAIADLVNRHHVLTMDNSRSFVIRNKGFLDAPMIFNFIHKYVSLIMVIFKTRCQSINFSVDKEV